MKKNALVLICLFSILASVILMPTAISHTPPYQIPTFSFCTVSPSPIGVGQTANVNFWVGMPPPTASGQFGDRWQNLTVTITKPDGTTTTLGPFTSDATGGSHTTYTPDTIGNYTFQMTFGGQTLTGENLAAGVPRTGPGSNPAIGDYFQPSTSTKFTLIVQEEQIPYPTAASLPTEYWTRPIYGENNAWYSISGNWLGTGQSAFAATGMYDGTRNYNPYTKAPNTAHILWTKPDAFGGMIGGQYGDSQTANFYATAQYEPKFAPIIMQGILYYTMYPGSGSNPSGWAAVNLHTGETIWTKNTTDVLRCGQILNMVTPNQFGALTYLWSQPPLPIITYAGFSLAGTLNMWDAMTGNYILTIQNASSMRLTTDDNGNLIGYYVNASAANAYGKPTLNMWNSTRCINLAIPNSYGGAPVADNWAWRPTQGAQIPFSLGIQWTKPLATDISGAALPGLLSISGVSDGVVLLKAAASAGGMGYQTGYQIHAGYSATDGSQLWIRNVTEVPYTLISTGAGTLFIGDGVHVEFTQNALSISCFSLTTGELLWGPTALPNASPFSSLGGNSVIANGTLYLWGYGGDVYAYDIANGNLKWQYHTPSGGYESPYGVEPLWTFSVGTVADGKLFLPEGHMYSPPLFHGAQQLALNITDGSLVWSIDAFDVTSAPAIADGIMTTLNAYDNQIYAWGKGPVKMSVAAPDVGVTTASPITIRGTIFDISAGSKQEAPAANFPNGLPCVSDDSQTDWMEYVYMQQPKPSNVTGVPVTLQVIDSNGNFRTIGTTVSNVYGAFSYVWTPDISGEYTLVADFAGTESYYPSEAATTFYASEPAATPTSQQAQGSNAADLYLLPGIVGIIITIVVVGAVLALLVTRKRL